MNRIAIITSEFNPDITHELYKGAFDQLLSKGIEKECIDEYWVPGAVEIPLIAKLCAEKSCYSAIIALGAVIRGETTHYDYVCDQVSDGVQSVMLQFNIPVIFGVLTTENEQQAQDRIGGAHGHKGRDSADAAIVMIDLIQKLKL